jgi:hypothetical protein
LRRKEWCDQCVIAGAESTATPFLQQLDIV